jgi:hypothetical protein
MDFFARRRGRFWRREVCMSKLEGGNLSDVNNLSLE